jgi:hypothetical protein
MTRVHFHGAFSPKTTVSEEIYLGNAFLNTRRFKDGHLHSMSMHINKLNLKGNLQITRNTAPSLVWNLPANKLLGFYQQGDGVNIQFSAIGKNLTSAITYDVETGTLPDGLNLNSSGLLFGSITDLSGTPVFTIRASSGATVADHVFQMIIGPVPAPIWDTPEGLVDLGTINQPVGKDAILVAHDLLGLPLQYFISGGSLPSGVFLNASTGVISGTYPQLDNDQDFDFTVSASNGSMATSRDFIIYLTSISPANAPFWVTPAGSVGQAYELSDFSTVLDAGDPNDLQITFVKVAGDIPPGLLLNSNTGVLSGTLDSQPDDTTFNFIIGAMTSVYTTKRLFQIKVLHDVVPVFTDGLGNIIDTTHTVSIGSVIEGNPFNSTITINSNPNLPVSFIETGLPSTITLDTDTGVVNSVSMPIVGGFRQPSDELINFTVTVSDGLKSATAHYVLTDMIDTVPVWFSDANSLGANFGMDAFDTNTATGGAPLAHDSYGRPVVYSLANSEQLPDTLAFDPNTGRINGTLPAAPDGDYDLTVTIIATSGPLDPISTLPGANPATKDWTISVFDNVPPVWDTPAGEVGPIIEQSNSTLSVSAHDPHEPSPRAQPVTYRLVTDAPVVPGLVLNANTGALEGTTENIDDPDQTTYDFTIEASYNGLLPINRDFQVTVQRNYPPEWDTPAGEIKSVLARQSFTFQLQAHDLNLTPITFALDTANSTIPTSITLSQDGVFSGSFPDNFIADTPYMAAATVSDGVNDPVARTFNIVSLKNTAPEWITPADTVIIDAFEGSTVSGLVQASDPEGQPVRYLISLTDTHIINNPDGSVILNNDGSISGIFPPVDQDTFYNFTVIAWDGTVNDNQTLYYTASRQFVLANRFQSPPQWSPPFNFEQVEQTMFNATVYASGVGNADHMIYSLVSGTLPPGIIFDANTATLSGTTPVATSPNDTYSFTLSAYNGVKTSNQAFSFQVDQNVPPVWVTGPNLTPALGQVSENYTLTATDANLPFGNDLVYTLVDIANVPSSIVFTSNNTLSGALPLTANTTTYAFTVAVSDGLAAPVLQTFVLTGLANENPVWNSGGELGPVIENTSFSASLNAQDPEGNAIVFALANGTNLPDGLTLSDQGFISGISPAQDSNSFSYPFTISANDGTPLISYQDFTLTVDHNYPPVFLTPQGNLGAVEAGYAPDVAQILAEDPNGTDLSHSFMISGGALPPGLNLKVDGEITGRVDNTQIQSDQEFDFSVSVSDGVNTVFQDFSYFVQVNLPPVFTPANGSLGSQFEQTNVVIHIDAVDPEGHTLTQQVVTFDPALNGQLHFDKDTGDITGVLPPVDQDTTVDISYLANDGVVSATADYSYTVRFNSPPVFQTAPQLPDGIEAQAYPGATIVAISNGSTVFYSISAGSLPGGLSMDANGVISGTCGPVSGDQNFSFTVQATTGIKASTRVFSIIVHQTAPPVWDTASLLSNANEVSTNNVYVLAAHDPNNIPLTFTLQNGALPTNWVLNSTPTSATVSGNGYPIASDQTYTFTVGASNGFIRTDRTFSLTLKYNNPPVFSANAGSLGNFTAHTTLIANVHATDSDGPNAVTYAYNTTVHAQPFAILDPSTGNLSGTMPSTYTPITTTFDVDATDGYRTTTRTFSITDIPDLSNLFSITDPSGTNTVYPATGNSASLSKLGAYTMTFLQPMVCTMKAWGAGGAIGGATGGFSQGDFTVTQAMVSNQTPFTIWVGGGGIGGYNNGTSKLGAVGGFGGGGNAGVANNLSLFLGSSGGLTGIFSGAATQANSILIAGGGAGGASDFTNESGAGGGSTGGNGVNYGFSESGNGGSQSAGGATPSTVPYGSGQQPGGPLQGGNAVTTISAVYSGTGGGGGYFGGGAGGGNNYHGSPGGGGSGYTHPTLLSNSSMQVGSSNSIVVPNSTDTLYSNSAGQGGTNAANAIAVPGLFVLLRKS